MRITWLVACEKILILNGPSLSPMNVYLGELPWRGPDIAIPFAVLMTTEISAEDPPFIPVSLRILSERGHVVAGFDGKIPGPDAGMGRSGKAIIEGFVSVEAPGRYSLEVAVDGVPLDDAPSWALNFVKVGGGR